MKNPILIVCTTKNLVAVIPFDQSCSGAFFQTQNHISKHDIKYWPTLISISNIISGFEVPYMILTYN